MQSAIIKLIDQTLRLIGCKTMDQQFRLSYVLVFILVSLCGYALYQSQLFTASTLNAPTRLQLLQQQYLADRNSMSRSAFDQLVSNLQRGNQTQQIQPLTDPELRKQLRTVQSHWQQLTSVPTNTPSTVQALQQALQSLEQQLARHHQQHQQFWLATAFGGVVALLVMIVLGRLIGVAVLMNNMTQMQKHLACVGTGDFSGRFPVEQPDNEIGHLLISYNEMLEQVSELMRQVQRTAQATEQHVESVIGAAGNAENGVNQQYMDIEQIATAMNQMAATVQHIASYAASAEGVSGNTNEKARTSAQVVSESDKQATEMQQNLQNTAQILAELEEETQAVGTVTSVINDIAEQTNLLALNAAIEAARAGDMGRGFAVVADEVRTLAQRTQSSTKEIRNIIERLQDRAQAAVQSMSESTQRADKSSELARSAATELQQIITAAEQICDLNIQISTATEQQSQVAVDIDQRVINISDAAANTREDTQKAVTATNEIRQEINQLNQLISRFKV